jgi:hypothetical protein
MSILQIKGIVEFEVNLICSKDALGQTIQISINDVPGTLTLPSVPLFSEKETDYLSVPLTSPPVVGTWKEGEKLISWGRLISYPDCTSEVKKALFEFNVLSSKTEEICNNIYEGFDNWIQLFYQYLRLITKQNTMITINVKNAHNPNLRLYDVNANLYKLQNNIYISVIMPDDKYNLNLTKLIEVCNLASSGKIPKLEYKLLLEAYNARLNNDPRKAIIEAANALEVCLTNRIMIEFDNLNIAFGEQLLDKFRMLGGRFNLMKILGINLPTLDYKTKILDPRNDVVHKAKFYDMATANVVILEVEKYLKEFSPSLN